MLQYKYTVVDGKHQLDDGTWIRKGDPAVSLEKAYADKFPGKFAVVAAPVEGESEKPAPAPK